MPSTKKRINLTVPDNIYQQLQTYKELNGISNDASACLQLVVQQLKAQENTRVMMQAFMAMKPHEMETISLEGMKALQQIAESDKFKAAYPMLANVKPQD